MKHYTSYIIRNLTAPVLLITTTLTGIIWLTQSLRFIDLIVNRGLSFIDFLYLSSLLLPSMLMIIIPVALFCAVLFIYNKLIIDSELIVFRSAGLGPLSLAQPALLVAFVLTLISYSISLYFLPASYRAFKDEQAYIRDNYASVLLQEGVFNTPAKGLTVYIEERLENGMLRGILVHDSRNPENPITMMAEEGKVIQAAGGPRFDLINGNRQEINHEDGQLSLLYFKRYTLDISTFTEATETRWREPQERYLHELFSPNDGTPEFLRGKLNAEGHQRLTWPLLNVMLILVALGALLSGQFNRRGQWKRILGATAVGVTGIVAHVGLISVIANTPMLTPLVYANIFLLSMISARVIYLQKPISFSRPVKLIRSMSA